MASRFFDDSTAARYREFQFEFADNSLAGRTVVVAGGTGGLGAATTVLLAREGARLVVGYRSNQVRAEALRAVLEKHASTRIQFVPGEISDPIVRRAYLEAANRCGAPLAGAAIFPGDPTRIGFEELDRDALLRSLEANYVGPLLLAKELGQAMEQIGSDAGIVLLATMQALDAFPGSLNYAPPKSALAQAARILAQRWTRVRVNVVAPGATSAGMAEASVRSGKYDRHLENGAIARFGRAEDVARAVRFFLEPDNYITGQTLVVDGGLTLRRDR